MTSRLSFRKRQSQCWSSSAFDWAVCDHPKYCDWGQGKYTGGGNKSLGAIEVNPDAAIQAIRTQPHPSSSSHTYDLLGRRVTPAYKGIVIRNGKLMIVSYFK